MCRLFGLSAGARRASATFWLLDAPDSLLQQSHREPDGTGLGWFDEHGLPQVDKQPTAAYEDREFARRAREVRSSTFVGHVRFASTGDLTLQNTHPFEQAGRLFAHNGVVEDLPALERRAGTSMQLVGGETDSERLFALITHEIAARRRRRRRRDRDGVPLGRREPPAALDQLRAHDRGRALGASLSRRARAAPARAPAG